MGGGRPQGLARGCRGGGCRLRAAYSMACADQDISMAASSGLSPATSVSQASASMPTALRIASTSRSSSCSESRSRSGDSASVIQPIARPCRSGRAARRRRLRTGASVCAKERWNRDSGAGAVRSALRLSHRRDRVTCVDQASSHNVGAFREQLLSRHVLSLASCCLDRERFDAEGAQVVR